MFSRHECETCGKKFRKVEQLMQHRQVVHEEKLYMCGECKVGFGGMEQMRDHAKKFHSYNRIKEAKKKN